MAKVINQEYGFATRVTTTGVSTIGAGLPIAMLGMQVPSQVTAGLRVQLFTQSGAAVLTGIPVVGIMTLTGNTFYRFPAYFQTGLTVILTNELVDLTIFWLPAD